MLIYVAIYQQYQLIYQFFAVLDVFTLKYVTNDTETAFHAL